jgi:anti-sigma factor ChrR (cupin superfamily)
MMKTSTIGPSTPSPHAKSPVRPSWSGERLEPLNDDFERRIVLLPEHAHWRPTLIPGVELRVLEHVPSDRPRLSAQIRFSPGHQPISSGNLADLEILIQRGTLESTMGTYPQGTYHRMPDANHPTVQNLTFSSIASSTQQTLSLIYIASGHMLETDVEARSINTLDASRWLPGPIENTDVLPLHGHGASNVMLIRWTGTAAFKPRLDPRGEEVLVLHGALYDSRGYYPAGTWIRNPIVAWQPWGAKTGTIIYYKNGHFADSTK